MARTYLSILTDDQWLENHFNQQLENSNLRIGYSGNNEEEFICYIRNQTHANHILFIQPTLQYLKAYNDADLRIFAKIDVIIIGPPLAHSQIGIIQASNLSGYVIAPEINRETIEKITKEVYRKGHFANAQIPEEFWLNHPKVKQILPMPKFSKREIEVLTWICHNYTYDEIAELLHTGGSNIRNYSARLRKKSFTDTSIGLVALAIANNWVTISSDKFKKQNPFLRNLPE
jgi:DNA-binding NarL/FixJ family response regulator